MRYFWSSFAFTVACLVVAAFMGWSSGGPGGLLAALFVVSILAVLEVSLSFDNAVVNAKVLMGMTPVWRRRFITWGILIAVFGMRIVFPLLVVGIMAEISPWQALKMAALDPERYAHVMEGARIPIAAFGGSFLAMVGFKYFFDVKKDVHWVRAVEAPLTRLGKIEAVEIALVLIILYAITKALPPDQGLGFLLSGMAGIVTFVFVEGIAALVGEHEITAGQAATGGFASFLYLEVLDASFSFDGVIGAFALTNNLFLIALGLGIGAMFVRSLTLMLVDKGTLTEYRYLEHGAFWAIIALAAMMLAGAVVEVPEVITGLVGAALIALSFWSSVRHNRVPQKEEPPE